jgi:cytochrome c peroxidase
MKHLLKKNGKRLFYAVLAAAAAITVVSAQMPENIDSGGKTYMPVVIEKSFDEIMKKDVADKPEYMKRQMELLERRYDMRDRPSNVMMSGGKKPVQEGVRVKLPKEMTWEKLAMMSPEKIREKDLFPEGFLPFPHVKHETGGQVFPENHIKEIEKLEKRSLERFDVEFDLPDHFLPEFPPPIFLTTRPDLGDVSQGKLLSITMKSCTVF